MAASVDWRGKMAMVMVTIQFGIQPFLTAAFIPMGGIKTTIVILQELIKSLCCVFALFITGDLLNVIREWRLLNSLKVALIPSIIYCTQNVLAFYAYLNLDPLTFNLINQSKIIFAAIFIKLILDKTPTKRQMLALTILFLTASLLTFDTTSSNYAESHEGKNAKMGIIAVVIASIFSGLAGTLTQRALQSLKKPRNSYLFSTELAFYGIIFSLLRLFIEYKFNIFDGILIYQHGFWYNLEFTVVIPVTVNAIGGIGVGLITKYASIIHKSYALICALLLSGICRSFLYAKPMSNAMVVAVPLVMLSLWLNADPSKIKKKKQ